MRKLTLIAIFYLLVLIPVGCFAQHSLHVIPQPKQVIQSNKEFILPKNPTWSTNVAASDQLTAIQALIPNEFRHTKQSSKATLKLLLLNEPTPSESNESYSMTITANTITIEAHAAVGLYYGLQTLHQLRTQNRYPQLQINDSPRFGYRGIMLDVSRHFFSKEFVFKQLDAMATFKLNRLHLHLTDAAGWRLEIKKYPELTRIGGWRTHENWKKWWFESERRYATEGDPNAFGGYYTQDDIREIVAYAQQRFITIIPEVELPAHSEEALVAYPHLSCSGKPYESADFCAGNDSVFIFWEEVLGEVAALFPSPHIHIGGDEAGKAMWHTCPKCQSRMKNEGLKNVDELQSYFIRRIERIAHKLGKQIIGWDEIMEGGVPPHATVMAWRGTQKALEAIAGGNSAILSPGEFCYLDAYQDSPLSQPEAIGGYIPLRKVYEYNPAPDTIPPTQAALIEGVQGNLWTEYVPTPSHCETMLYPRALAIAEIGWSQNEDKNWPDFHRRTLLAIEKLRKEGYTPFDLANEVGNRPAADSLLQTVSVGKRVTYNLPYHPAYVAQREATLTDGLRGGWTYGDRRWQGFIGSGGFDVVIDLEEKVDITAIYADFMQSAGAEVYLPATFNIAISDDNIDFTPLWDETYPTSLQHSFQVRRYGFSGQAAARYVRIRANYSQLGGWLFTDEIVIEGVK